MFWYIFQPLLDNFIHKSDQILADINDYRLIQETVKQIQNEEKMKSLVDIGLECFVNAVIEDKSVVLLDVGLNCFIEVPIEKCSDIIDEKVQLLYRKLEFYSKKREVIEKDYLSALMSLNNLKTLSSQSQ